MIGDLYNISPAKFGQTRDFVTRASNFGKQTQHWHGVDVNVQARMRNGLTLQGGTSTGREVQRQLRRHRRQPEPAQLPRALPFQTQVKGLATYTIPKIDRAG